jgi:hypothetical protein
VIRKQKIEGIAFLYDYVLAVGEGVHKRRGSNQSTAAPPRLGNRAVRKNFYATLAVAGRLRRRSLRLVVSQTQ